MHSNLRFFVVFIVSVIIGVGILIPGCELDDGSSTGSSNNTTVHASNNTAVSANNNSAQPPSNNSNVIPGYTTQQYPLLGVGTVLLSSKPCDVTAGPQYDPCPSGWNCEQILKRCYRGLP